MEAKEKKWIEEVCNRLDFVTWDSKEKKWIEEVCNRLDFVTWDRYVHCKEFGVITIFGWIDRKKDGYKDFVLLDFTLKNHKNPSCVYFIGTSSAEYSEKIAGILGTQHTACKRAEWYFRLDNMVKEKKSKDKRE